MAKPPGKSGKPPRPRKARGFGEAQAPFQVGQRSLAALFEAYGFACAFTGKNLRAEVAADPHGSVVRLDGAVTMPGTVIPACLDAIHAFERGHLSIGTRYEFLVALDRIDPEFLERLNPIGRLSLPADPRFNPDAALLAVQRAKFAEGLLD